NCGLLQELREATKNNPLYVLSGPTAVGKGTLSTYLRLHDPKIWVSISCTTRDLRPQEVEGVHYYPIDESEFQKMIDQGEFLEWARVHNDYLYGTPIRPLLEAIQKGKTAVLEIDIQGARAVRKILPKSRFVFLEPPTFDTLIERQKIRDTEDYAERQLRLKNAEIEIESKNEFDFVIVNDKVEVAQVLLQKIIKGV
ncbi:MAG: guanylate kinase, partial [Bifidobacteriaceae bacterium]|nr:guanylate kinase [Bifidobacteriaceae bacterium]